MDFRRLFDILPYQDTRYPQKVALAERQGLKWHYYSTSDCLRIINQVSAGLLDLGLQKGDRVGIMTLAGSPRWNLLDLGMQQIGVVVVPIHAAIDKQDLIYILRETEIRHCIVTNRELYNKVQSIREEVPILQKVFTLEKLPDIPGWDDLIREPTSKHYEKFQTYKAAIHEDDLATIIYTSGTTGEPKGVMLSHKNIVSNIKSIIALAPINASKRAISFLPLSHVFERMVTFTYMAAGTSVYYATRKEQLDELIREVKPHFFTAVPRFLEKAYEQILERSADRGRSIKTLVNWAVRIGKKYGDDKRMGLWYWIQHLLADILVYRIWRSSLGGKVEGIMVGAAALNPELGRLFSAAGFEVREGYGLTETSPVVSFNRFEPGGVRFGTVGIPVPGVEVKIDAPDGEEEGEVLVKGPNVMQGYFNKPEETRHVIQEDGWLRTGDVGKIVHKHFLQITDRKKHIFKTSTGKYVAPQRIENKMRISPYIEQVMLLGHNQPFVAALIIPCFPILKQWCEENNVHWTAPQFMVLNPKVIQLINEEVERINALLLKHEQVKKVHLLHKDWSEEEGELTPTLKLKREVVKAHYQKEIDAIYTL